MKKNISYKIFVKLLLIMTIIFLVYHSLVWTFFTSNIFSRKDGLYIGDIGRISYQVDSLVPRKLEFSLKKRILNHEGYIDQKVDIVTIGDSFSDAGGGGLNPYYQDFIATKYNKNILNLKRMANNDHTPFELTLILYNTGWLKKHKPEMLIIESAERAVYTRFAKEFDFSFSDNNATISISGARTKDSHIPKLLMINTANYKLPFYTLKYKFKNRAFKTVAKVKLNKKLFSTKGYEDTLLFHYDDITKMQNNAKKIELINTNFNKLASLLKSLNIKLVFMPVVDKYDLYSNYIIDNPYPINNFFDIIRPLRKNYYFIDTKKILSPLLEDGQLNTYYSDDTHWSFKASAKISETKLFYNSFSQ